MRKSFDLVTIALVLVILAPACKTDVDTVRADAASPSATSTGPEEPSGPTPPTDEQENDKVEPCTNKRLTAKYVRLFRKRRRGLFGTSDNADELRSHGCMRMEARVKQWLLDHLETFCQKQHRKPVENIDWLLDIYLDHRRTRSMPRFFGTRKVCQETLTSCQNSKGCTERGRCGVDTYEKESRGTTQFCVVTQKGCAQSEDCKQNGLCTAKDGQCVAMRASDCRQATACAQQGLCTLKNGACIAAADEDCSQAQVCTLHGRCTATNKGACIVSTHAACEASKDCKQEGLCTAQVGSAPGFVERCVAEFDADCEQSTACKEEGRCKASESGRCVAQTGRVDGAGWPVSHQCDPLQDPVEHRECKTDGDDKTKCGRKSIVCNATAAYCKQQPACDDKGYCAPVQGFMERKACDGYTAYVDECPPRALICGPTNQTCANSKLCAESGRCGVDYTYHRAYTAYEFDGNARACAPLSGEHCQASAACKQEGKCALIEGAKSPPQFNFCTPTKESHCKQSKACKDEGRCTLQHSQKLPYAPNRCVRAEKDK